MATASLVALAVLSLVVLVLATGLLANLGARQLSTPLAIAHDGPRVGRPAPRLEVRAVDGSAVVVPAGRRQVLLFTDHSLMDFEELLAVLIDVRADRPDVVVFGSGNRTSAALLEGLGLDVPVALVPHAVYDRYRVRVMPYAVVVDASGLVVTSGLVNTPFQLRHLAEVGLERARLDAGHQAQDVSS
jgi:hypothetical protein